MPGAESARKERVGGQKGGGHKQIAGPCCPLGGFEVLHRIKWETTVGSRAEE